MRFCCQVVTSTHQSESKSCSGLLWNSLTYGIKGNKLMVWSCFKLFEAKRLLFCCYELWTRVEKRKKKKKKKKVESSSRSLPRNERLHSDAAACCWLLLVMCTSFLSFRRLLFFLSFFVSTFARIKAVNKFCFLLITTLDPSCWFFQMNKAHQLIVAEAPSVLQCSLLLAARRQGNCLLCRSGNFWLLFIFSFSRLISLATWLTRC